jgi:1,2-diacylglycerol 3-alpha-glucosyltransferase
VKLVVIFHRFGPYHWARLEAASRRSQIVGIELGSETSEYGWSKIHEISSFERITLFPGSDSRSRPLAELTTVMRETLSRCQADAVAIPGWSDKGALAALAWCIDNKVPAVLMSETTADDEARVWWKESVKRRIVRLCSAALVGGVRQKEYLSDWGMFGDRVFTGYDAVDNDYFARRAKGVRGRKSEVRREHGLPENYFLASARFIPKKNLAVLIRAYAEYREKSEDERRRTENRGQRDDLWHLVILGDGPLKQELQTLIAELGLRDSVLLPGFKQYDELPIYYAMASAFVHPSTTEQWGLVVNEAMASGLPVIVSNRCGCAPELVDEGTNGFTFDPSDQTLLASRLTAISALSIEERERMGQASQEMVRHFAPEKFGKGLERAASYALSCPSKYLGLIDGLILNRVLSR